MSLVGAMAPYLQLLRLPAVFSAWSNILAAHLIATAGVPHWRLLAWQIGIATCLYWAGMVLNDCFDRAEDRRERPQRPLASGRVPLAAGWGLGTGLLALGLLLGLMAGGATLSLTLLLAAAVLLYDGLLKRGPLGPAAMGLCRYLNWLVGLSAAPVAGTALALALPMALYTAGVTVLSRIETGGERRAPVLAAAALVLLAGLAVIGLYAVDTLHEPTAVVALGALTALIGTRLWRIYRDPVAAEVQAGVKLMLLGMIPLDALLVLGDGQWAGALLVLALLIPGKLLARGLYMT